VLKDAFVILSMGFFTHAQSFSDVTLPAHNESFISDYCILRSSVELNTSLRPKVADECKMKNTNCEAFPSRTAKALCLCEPNRIPKAEMRERCFEVAMQVIERDNGSQAATLLREKIPHCAKIKEEIRENLDTDSHYARCLRNAFFDTNLAIQGELNRQQWMSRSKEQEIDRFMRTTGEHPLNWTPIDEQGTFLYGN
jgi:hypothetical protein